MNDKNPERWFLPQTYKFLLIVICTGAKGKLGNCGVP